MQRLELGKLYFKITNFDQAIDSLARGLEEAELARDWPTWCNFLPMLLRIHAERMEFSQVDNLKRRLRQLEQDHALRWTSTTHYAFGIASAFERNMAAAERHFAESIRCAQNFSESTHARYGLAVVASQAKRHEENLIALGELRAELSDSTLTDLYLAAGLLSAITMRELERYEEATELLSVLQRRCKIEQNLYLSLNALYVYGTVYQKCQQFDRAIQTYELIQSLMDPRDLKHLAHQVEARIQEICAQTQKAQVRLVGDSMVQLPDGRQIDLQNQFIIRSLLKLLGGQPGGLTKEEIVTKLWREEYNPMIHDNKLYVTIRRLRKLIEPESLRPHYILNTQDGYLLNPNLEFKLC